MKSRQIRIFTALSVLIFIMGFFLLPDAALAIRAEPVESGADSVPIYYFYHNPCAACDTEGEFVEFFNQEVGDVKESAQYHMTLVNVFQAGEELMNQAAEEAGVPQESRKAPLLIVGNRWIQGEGAIQKQFRPLFCQVFGIENSSVPGESAANQKDSGASSLSEPEAEGLPPIDKNSLYLRYYYTASCQDCQKVKPLLDQAGEQVAGLRIDRLSLADTTRVPEIQELFRRFDVPEGQRQVPIVFWENGYLSGVTAISEGLQEAAASSRYQGFADDLAEGGQGSSQPFSIKQLPMIAAAGLVGGLNPCGLSMLLLLLSVLIIEKKHALSLGLTYLIAKGATYFVIALGLYSVLSLLESQLFQNITMVLRIVCAVALAAAAVLSFMDFLACRREDYGKVRLQLPEALRSFNNRLIGRLQSARGRKWFYLAIALVSIVVSAGEFLCTGQVMLATLLYMAQNQTGNGSTLALGVYVICMLIPLLAVVLAVAKGSRVLSVSEAVRGKMPLMKLLTAGLFLAFAVLTVALW